MAALRPITAAAAGLLSAGIGMAPLPAAGSLFLAKDVDGSKFILVAAPIGGSGSAQLNIYEQKKDTRPCYSREGDGPTVVKPLLATFDFTGICGRYMDSNGYSVRVGAQDFGSGMRMSVVPDDNDLLLMGTSRDGSTVVLARTEGLADGFLELKLEPGWTLKRRHYGERALGHIYVHRDTMPEPAGEEED